MISSPAEEAPAWLDVQPEGIAPELRASPHWVVWEFGPRAEGEKATKLPVDAGTKAPAKANDPATWTDFNTAMLAYFQGRGRFCGVGYVFAESAGLVGIDLDDCRNAKTGKIAPWAIEIVERFASYSEISPSGTGVKIWCKGRLPGDGSGKRRDYQGGVVEMYGRARFFCVTGHRLPPSPAEIIEAQAAINWLWAAAIEPPKLKSAANGSTNGTSRSKRPATDVIERARRYVATMPEAISGQGGHNATFAVACVLVLGFDLSVDEARPLLAEYNERCQPPWGERELEHKLQQADAKGDERGYLRDAPLDGDRGVQNDHPSKSSGQLEHLNGSVPSVTNGTLVEYEDDDGKEKSKIAPMPMANILANILSTTGNWPRRVGGALFVDQGEGRINWLETPSGVFGWLGNQTGIVRWHRGTGFSTKEETFSELRRTATDYQAVETLPHFPPMARHYYSCKPTRRGDGATLRAFLERFNPSTQIDQDLFLAAIVTPFWGGPPGCRPAFMWTADSGRGAGKSKNAAMVARVAGGAMDFAHGEDIKTIKERLLSPEGQGCRIALLDNVKTMRFSWAEIEALITATTISGKRMYIGEAARPNTITWFITLNGASLSTDLAQRVIPIKINPPERVGNWEEETIRFIEENRQALVDDIEAFFTRPTHPPRSFTRWATWEQHVLSRLAEPEEAQAVILERQGAADVEREEADIIEDHFRERLADLRYSVETERVHIPSLIASRWFNEATGERKGTTATTRAIKQLCEENKTKRLQMNPCKTYGRGFLWVGDECIPEANVRTDLCSRLDTQKQPQDR